jgi:phage nucleotide-binding protein
MPGTSVEVLRPRQLGGLKIIKAKERAPHMNILIYGESGVGKTRLAGSADSVPRMRKVLVIDLEGGTLTLEQNNPDVDIIRVKNWSEMQTVYDALYSGDHDYETVIIDSLTEVQKFNMYSVMENRVETSSANVDVDAPDMRAWGINLEQMRKYVRAFRDLPFNTIFTALVKDDKDKKTGLTMKKPSLSGKLASEVAAFLDIVSYMYMKEVDGEQTRLLLSSATDDVIAKDRTGKLPVVMLNPTMESILDHIEGKVEAKTE